MLARKSGILAPFGPIKKEWIALYSAERSSLDIADIVVVSTSLFGKKSGLALAGRDWRGQKHAR